jgi:hypothetical protein
MRCPPLWLLLALTPAPTVAREVPRPPRPPRLVTSLPPRFNCYVTRETPLGTITAQQAVSRAGVRDVRLDGWATLLAPDGVAINASWEHPSPDRYNLIQISQSGLDPARSYRIQVQGDAPAAGEVVLLLESPLARPDPDGALYIFTSWELVTAMLHRAFDPRIVVIRDDGSVVRSDRIDPASFNRVLAAAGALQPALDALIADYRNLCQFDEGGPISQPVQVPG